MSVVSAFENWSLKFVNNAEDMECGGNHFELLCRVLTAIDEGYFSGLNSKLATPA